jgi:antitoxin PrlF
METTLAERGQIVIPKALREQLGLVPGCKLDIEIVNGRITISKKPDDALAQLRGKFTLSGNTCGADLVDAMRGRAERSTKLRSVA